MSALWPTLHHSSEQSSPSVACPWRRFFWTRTSCALLGCEHRQEEGIPGAWVDSISPSLPPSLCWVGRTDASSSPAVCCPDTRGRSESHKGDKFLQPRQGPAPKPPGLPGARMNEAVWSGIREHTVSANADSSAPAAPSLQSCFWVQCPKAHRRQNRPEMHQMPFGLRCPRESQQIPFWMGL